MAGGVRRIAKEQAALRRVAVLVARGESPEEVFAAVAAEAGRVLHAQHAWIGRYDPDGTLSVVAAWTSSAAVLIPVGTRISSGGRNLITLVLQTGRPARLDDYVSATGAAGTLVHKSGIRASVGAQNAGQPAGQEVRVNSVCCLQAQRAAHLGGIQRTEQQVVGPAEEWPVISCQPFHHVQVTAQQQKEYGAFGQQPVPSGLQGTVEDVILLGQPWQFVEDDDSGRVWKHCSECPERVRPACRRLCGHETAVAGHG
jgi:GAF domain-containing protein